MDFGEKCDLIAKCLPESPFKEQIKSLHVDMLAVLRRSTLPEKEIRLFDSQWMNIVNHGNCWERYTKEEAIHAAVKMAEEKMAENFILGKWPDIRT